MFGFVYILRLLRNNTFYIGSTSNLERRIFEHQGGRSKYTKEVLPVVLVFSQRYATLRLARKMEHWLKKQKDKDFIGQIVIEGKIKKMVA